MRRNDKEITDVGEIEAIIRRAVVCRLGMTDGQWPYVVPVSFGYEPGCLYFHSSCEGRKLEMMKANDRVCFEMDIDQEVVEGDEGCSWSMRYKSVIGFGRAVMIEDAEEKKRALGNIMRQYSDREFQFPDEAVGKVAIFKVVIEGMSGKRSG